jgi:eukaryotic-like serine/threonine-protein kinase
MTPDAHTPDRLQLYHYKLDRILGEGGTGRVYRGVDTKKGEVAAIKLFHENFFRSRLHVRDLVKSVKKFRKMDHPNLVKIHGFIEGKEGRCMPMEYVDGPNLKWYLLHRPWDLQERIKIMIQICNGLQYLHDQDCIHNDFKPSNVLFTRRGTPKVADFSLYGGGMLLDLIRGGIGEQITPMFVAPEFLRKEKVTPAADLYSLGITMYMLFADKVPFSVDTVQRLYQCHLQYLPDHPSTHKPECPRNLGDLIMRLLQKKPEDRFRDCDELRSALDRMGRSRI